MKHYFLPIFFALALLFSPLSASAFTFDPNFIISDSELEDYRSMTLSEIEDFLERGYLADYETEDWEGVRRTAAEIIYNAALNAKINPKFLIVLLQKEQSLIEDEDPTQKQLDWATGYGVCDYCSMSDSSIARWQGFGKQVNSAGLQFTEGYMTDIEALGSTQGIYGPGLELEINGEKVVPENAATAALYAYTPHMLGNQNFAVIYDNWFGSTADEPKEYGHITGTLLQAVGSPNIYLIDHGLKRHITSWSAFATRFSLDLVQQVEPEVLERYVEGRSLSFPNYSLLEGPSGTRYLLVDDTLKPFASDDAFRKIGFIEDELVQVTQDEVDGFEIGTTLTEETAHPEGKILRVASTGAMFAIQDGKRRFISDDLTLEARFPNHQIIDTTGSEVSRYMEGKPLTLPDGYLVKSEADPQVYVISDGKRRLIGSEDIFYSHGFDFDDVHLLSNVGLRLHEMGTPLSKYISQ